MTYREYLKTHIEKVLPKALKSFEDKNGFSLPEFSIDEIYAVPKSSYFTKNIIRFGNVMMTVSVKEKDNRMGRLKKFLETILEGVLSSLDYEYEGIYIDFTKTKKNNEEEIDLLQQVSYLFKVYKPKWVENYSVEETKTDDTTFFDFYIQIDPTDWDDRKTDLESINQSEDPDTFFEKNLVGYYWHKLSDIFDNKIDKFINLDGDKFYGYKFIIERSNVGTIEELKHTDEKESKKLEKSLILFFKEEIPNVLDFELTKLIKNEKSNLVILKGDLKIKSEVKGSDKKLYQILNSNKLKDIIKNIKLIYKTINPKDLNLNVDIDVKYSTKGKLTENKGTQIKESKERKIYLINKLIEPDKQYTHSDSYDNIYDDINLDVSIDYKVKLTDIHENESDMGYSVKLVIDIQRILIGIKSDDIWESVEKDDIPSWIFDDIGDEILDKFDNFLPSVYVNDIEYI